MRLHPCPGSQGWELAESGTSQAGSSRIHTLILCTRAHMDTAPVISVDWAQSPAERGRQSSGPGLRHPVPAPQEATGTLIWGRVIKPVSWRIWSSKWVTASSCMTWPPRTNSRRPVATSWRTLALWAERKSHVTAPELCLVVFVGDMPTESHGPSFKLHSLIYSVKAERCLSWSSLLPAPRTAPVPGCRFIRHIHRYICSQLLLLNDAKIMENLQELYQKTPTNPSPDYLIANIFYLFLLTLSHVITHSMLFLNHLEVQVSNYMPLSE